VGVFFWLDRSAIQSHKNGFVKLKVLVTRGEEGQGTLTEQDGGVDGGGRPGVHFGEPGGQDAGPADDAQVLCLPKHCLRWLGA
jgi:hypothetical protein